MKKAFCLILIAVLALNPAMALAEGEGANLLFNADFEQYSEQADLPAGWELAAYDAGEDAVRAGLYEDETYGLCIGIESYANNDARVCQTITVDPDTVYRLSCKIRTQDVSGSRGATVSVDNYDVDGTYCFSEDVSGSVDWTDVEIYVRTGEKQRTMVVAMRLGGYGTTASGKAWFSNISASEAEPGPGVKTIDLETETGAAGTVTRTATEDVSYKTVYTGILILTAAVIAFGALLYWRRVRTETGGLFENKDEQTSLIAILFMAFGARLILSVALYGHPTDINCFMSWGNAVLSGPSKFYTSGFFADYPPGYMYICGALAWLANFMHLPYGSTAYAFLFKLPATVADLLSAFLIFNLARKNGIKKSFALTLSALVALNPVLMFISGGWGQIDSILALCLVFTLWLLNNDQRIWAGLVFGVAILIKPQALMAGPLLAVIYIRSIFEKDWAKRLLETLLAVIAAIGAIFVLALPFQGDQGFAWLIEKYLSTANGYPYASIEAFNFLALIGGNWTSINATFLGISFKAWGTGAILTAVVLSTLLYLKAYSDKNRGTPYLILAFELSMIFTFGHYMHERYLIPVLLLLLIAYIYYRDRRILAPFFAFTGSILLNATAAMYVINRENARGAFYNAITVVGSILTVVGFLLLAYIVYEVIVRKKLLPPVAPEAGSDGKTENPNALTIAGKDFSLSWSLREKWCLLALVAVYGVVQLTNLGSLSAPETVYSGAEAGETFTVSFPQKESVSEIWINGNIDNGGMLLFTGDDGVEITYEQLYDNMFRWQRLPFETTTGGVRVMVYSGTVAINELAFFDLDGNLIPASVDAPSGTQAALLDEQDTVPSEPSYLNGMYLDELYHGRTAYEHLHNLAPYENSHPPLGKLFIMIGVALFGMNAFGWRVIGALFGIAMLPVFYALARRLLKNAGSALAATALFAFDFMHFTQTRIATIDVYAVFFILVMYYFMYRYITLDYFHTEYRKTLPALALAGVFFGVGAACKWTCIYAGAGLAVLLFITMYLRFREAERLKKTGTAAEKKAAERYGAEVVKTLLWCCLFYIAIPFTIYFAAYIPYYRYEAGMTEGYGLKEMFGTFWRYQDFMYSYHSGLNATHPYQSAWYEWPFTIKPMWYYFSSGDGRISTLSASGNPAVWWISTLASVALFGLLAARKVKKDRALLLIGVGILANYLPWVLVSRCTFIYHFFATVPFIILGGMYLVTALEEKEPAVKIAKWFWVGLAILMFILLYPGISGLPVPTGWAAALKKLPGGILMYGA